MTNRYTADDFASAKFAEHPETDTLAVQRNTGLCEWTIFDDDGYTGWVSTATMLEVGGWVPVPTKPTLTDSQLEEACGQWYESDDFLMGFMAGYEKAGGEIIPDPEPTNTELLAGIIRGIDDWQSITSPELLAKYLNTAGVTPPKEDK